jgi:hypothetical protein
MANSHFLKITFFIWIGLFLNCTQPNNVLTVDGGGIDLKGHVYSIKDSLPIDSVRIILTAFKGTNLKRKYYDVSFFSDSTGFFGGGAAVGYQIKGADTIDRVHSCKAIFSKQGFIDTTFAVDQSERFNNLKIFMQK